MSLIDGWISSWWSKPLLQWSVSGRRQQGRHVTRCRDSIGRSEGFALTGYDIPGCVEDGAWMLWENSSVVAAAAVAHPGLEQLFEFHYGIGPSGVRGSIRLVFRSTDARILSFFPCRNKSNIEKNCPKKIKNDKKHA